MSVSLGLWLFVIGVILAVVLDIRARRIIETDTAEAKNRVAERRKENRQRRERDRRFESFIGAARVSAEPQMSTPIASRQRAEAAETGVPILCR